MTAVLTAIMMFLALLSMVDLSAAASQSWKQAAGLPAARSDLAMGVLNNAIYVFGGADAGGNAQSNAYRYNGTNWVEVASLPAARYTLAAGVLNGALYALGGRNASHNPTTNVYRFNGTNWAEVASLPAARWGLAAGVLNGALYALGGYDSSATNSVYCYNGTNWTAVASLPAARYTLAAGVLNGALYALGGYTTGSQATNDVYRFDGTTWTQTTNLPDKRSFVSAVTLNNGIYAIGGYNSGAKSNVFRFNGTAWTQTAALPAVRCGMAAGLWSNAIYAVGGNNGTTSQTNMYRFDEGLGLLVLGTNGAVVADGEPASIEKGTDFGAFYWGLTRTNVLSLVNTGAGPLAISAVLTNGAGADVFRVLNLPGQIDSGATSAVSIVFTPVAAITYTAQVSIVNNGSPSPYVLNFAGVGEKCNQTITFPGIPDQTVTSSVALAATAGSGLAVSFSVAGGPGTISGDNILTFTSTGMVQVMASQGGDALWNAAANVANNVTVHDISTLATPQNLAASDGTYTDKVAVTWSAVSGAGGYQVWRAGVNNLGAAVNLGNAGLPGYDDNSSAARSATMFYYWVKAFNSVATSEFSAVDSGFCRSTENPAIISGQPMVGDYDGDRKADPAVYDLNSGRLFAWLSSAAYLLVTPVVTFQAATGDLPVAGDFDGDRLADPGVFQRLTGSWYIWLSSAGYYRVGPLSFGIDLNDIPIPADYDGDGKADPAVCNAGLEWYVWLSGAGYYRVGPLTLFRVDASDIPAPGQFDADLLADPGVYQAASGNWYVWLSSAGYYRIGPVTLGTTGEHLAVPADYDGDDLADPAAYVPSNGVWRIWESGNGYALKELPLK